MLESSTPPKKIQNLRSFTVQIRHIQRAETTVGTGFVVSPDGLIATCAHVVVTAGVNPRFGKIPGHWELIRQSFFPSGDALQTDRTVALTVYFLQARLPQERRQTAIVVGCFQDSDDDVVLLKLQADSLPEGVGVAIVDSADDSVNVADDRRFRSYGYRRLGNYQGLQADGALLGTTDPPAERILLKDPLQLRSQEIDSGMSGGAVLDMVRDRVVGIIAETSDIRTGTDRDTSFAVDYAVVIKLLNPDASSAVSSTQGDAPVLTTVSATAPPIKPVALTPEPAPKQRFDLSRAPTLVEEWVGRDALLAALNQDWADPQCHVTAIIGFGGEGKSTFARQWVENIQRDAALPVPDGVFWWGFYEQPNVDEFLNAVLNHLDLGGIDPGQLTSVDAKAQTIRAMRGRYLFVLDGLEVLQEQEGDDYGLLKNRDLCTFLRTFADGNHASFCLLTSRFPVLDLIDYTTYQQRELGPLNRNAGCQLLKKIGVKGSEKELAEVVDDWGGYALSLRWVGTYLLDKHSGNVKRVREIPVPDQNQPAYDRLQSVLRSYDGYITQAEREFLNVFSLFRLPVVASNALQQVFEAKRSSPYIPPRQPPLDPITKWLRSLKKFLDWVLRRKTNSRVRLREKLNVPVTELSSSDFNALIRRLVAYRIVKDYLESSYFTLHPLIRAHYLAQLAQGNSDWVKTVHRRIGEFYEKNTVVPEFPSLSDLTPLIEAVHHLCQAGDYDEGYRIYRDRVDQGSRGVITSILGAYETELNLIQEFFLEGDTTQNPQVSDPGKQRFILNELGLCLTSLGRLREAPSFYERQNEITIQQEDWHNTSITYQNLASLYVYLGDIPASATAAESALTYAHRAENQQEEHDSLVRQAWADHLSGHLDTAIDAFQQAAALLQQREPDEQYLSSVAGIHHADHLRRRGDADYARRITEANQVTCEQYHWLNDLSLCHRVLGDLDADANVPTAQSHYNEALQIARRISKRNVLIEALLARGRWAARQADAAAAGSDLEEALGYAVAGGYRLYEADIRVGLAWMHRAAGNLEAARQEALRAQRMSEAMGYYWGQKDAAEVLEALEQVA